MPSWCVSSTLYKGILVLVFTLIILEYLFGSITETKSLEHFFPLNSTRFPLLDKELSQKHRSVIKNKTVANISVNTNEINPTNYSVLNISVAGDSSSDIETISNMTKLNNTKLEYCPDIPPNLQGKVEIIKTVPSVQQLEKRFSWLHPGGHWYPPECKVQKKVAIIIPFRCRGEHLLLFLQHMHPFLKKQLVDYTIYIVEQDGKGVFNRAMLMNIGFKESLKMSSYDCFIFHDVDLLPENDKNLYTCPEQPRHMSVAVDIFKYKLPYTAIFGGVSAITKEHFQLLNGFSNSFWGWGGEDDDMSNRIRYHNLHISRYPITIARYTMLTHVKDKPSPNRYEILKSGQRRFLTDGLNNLHYSVKRIKKNLLYTWILVQVERPS